MMLWTFSFARSKQTIDIIRATAEEIPLIRNKPLNVPKFKVLGFGWDDEERFWNHFFSRSPRVPFSLILAICLDISVAKGDPF